MMHAIKTSSLGKRYRSFEALKDCTITVPAGTISALVGPNGSGKTTLLKLLAGLNRPTGGSVTVLGQTPGSTSAYLSQVGYLAQQIPLYDQFTAADHVAIGQHTEVQWDNELAVRRLHELQIPLDRPVGKLSGGQRSQVGLAMALAKKPKLLLLDEPVAALDPLARAEFLSSLAQAVADMNGQLTVLMSSHLLTDLERICDHLVILASGATQLCDDIEHVLETHKLLVGTPGTAVVHPDATIIKETRSTTTAHVLVHSSGAMPAIHGWHVHDVAIEEVVLAYMEQGRNKKPGRGDL